MPVGFSTEWSEEADLQRRVDARRAMEDSRDRVFCKRCRKAIPEGKRRNSVYCSQKCRRAYRWEERTALREEIRATMRSLTAPTHCQCGVELDNPPGKAGRIMRSCKKCGALAKDRRYKAKRREANQREVETHAQQTT